jgi:hypothetical protein
MDTTTLPTPTHRRRPWSRNRQQDEPIIRVRALAAGDAATLDAVFDGLSARSRYLRFHSPRPRLTTNVRRRLLDVDGDRHSPWPPRCGPAAVVPIGIGRVLRIAPGVGELAVEVVDDWQGRGSRSPAAGVAA